MCWLNSWYTFHLTALKHNIFLRVGTSLALACFFRFEHRAGAFGFRPFGCLLSRAF